MENFDYNFNRIARHIRSVSCRVASYLAAQQILGIRSERYFGRDRADPHRFIADRTPLNKMRPESSEKDFPVVCVGGSAGGLDAYTRLLQHLPADMGVAIVIVNHLRTVATMLHEILPRYTKMPVELITERLTHRAQPCVHHPGTA